MLLPLDMLRVGDCGEIAEVSGDATWVGRLAELGLKQGCRFSVLQSGTPCLLDVSGTRLCLRGGECSQILVRPFAATAV